MALLLFSSTYTFKTIEDASAMLEEDMSLELITKITGLPIEELTTLRKG